MYKQNKMDRVSKLNRIVCNCIYICFFTTFFLLEMTGFQVGACVGGSFGLFLTDNVKLTKKLKSCGDFEIKGKSM